MDRFQSYLYRNHSRQKILGWANALTYFRFCRAYGGHANDGDQFLAAIRIDCESDLHTVLESLGLKAIMVESPAPQPEPGRPYSAEDFSQFVNLIKEFPHMQQIGHCKIDGNSCHVWSENHRLTISVIGAAGDPYEVDDGDFERAIRIDSCLEVLSDRVVDPPQDNRNCICPKFHPDLWVSAG